MKTAYTPLVVIGAPRSGTNMLRDALTSLPGLATWPCDEINYVWRHGNVRYPSDELKPEQATDAVRRYIRRQFDRVAWRYRAHTVVEKTCANSLRVGFVDHVLPDARYVFIRRDGLDVVGSAMQRWKAALDIPYLARKARFVPPSDLPYYAARYLWNRIHRLRSREARLAFWGPRLDGMEALLAEHTLEEVCALQWQRCVESAQGAFLRMAPERYVEVEYEAFAREPERELRRITGFLGYDADHALIRNAVSGVSDRSLGRGRAALGDSAVERLRPLVGDTLARYGYA